MEPKICLWCANRTADVCSSCSDEGRYRYLVPEPLPSWETPPELPPMRDLVEMQPWERLALVYLIMLYERMARERA